MDQVRRILGWMGVVVDSLSKEEAAVVLLEREVSFRWRPQIVETAHEPGVDAG